VNPQAAPRLPQSRKLATASYFHASMHWICHRQQSKHISFRILSSWSSSEPLLEELARHIARAPISNIKHLSEMIP
jgi:hypothetical protein